MTLFIELIPGSELSYVKSDFLGDLRDNSIIPRGFQLGDDDALFLLGSGASSPIVSPNFTALRLFCQGWFSA